MSDDYLRRYIAPELKQNPNCPKKIADVYSLGVIIVEMFLGKSIMFNNEGNVIFNVNALTNIPKKLISLI